MAASVVSWGIAGCGWVARDYAGPAIEASCNGRIAAVYDPDAASRIQATAAFPGVAAHADLGAFLATPGLGAIYVASPNHVHRALVEAKLRLLAERPQIVGAHLCLGDPAASAVQTAEKQTRPTKALTPNWVVMVEGGGDRGALEAACDELLPTAMLADAGHHATANMR